MNESTKTAILERYERHVQRFEQDAAAVRRRTGPVLDVPDGPVELQSRESALSERELHMLRHLANGLTDQEIGDAAGISEFTVKTYLRRLYGKLGARNRAHAVARAVARGYLVF
jgi:DNA-binding CsgD family transcriptional regulator